MAAQSRAGAGPAGARRARARPAAGFGIYRDPGLPRRYLTRCQGVSLESICVIWTGKSLFLCSNIHKSSLLSGNVPAFPRRDVSVQAAYGVILQKYINDKTFLSTSHGPLNPLSKEESKRLME